MGLDKDLKIYTLLRLRSYCEECFFLSRVSSKMVYLHYSNYSAKIIYN
jgi:hypothetical protein